MNKIINLGKEITERGFVAQISTESIDGILGDSKKRTAYIGVDPTADSIHVGNLVTYILAEHLMRAGHKTILLVGGATGLIGDPSGKDTERVFSGAEKVAQRTECITSQLAAIAGLSKMKIVNNYDWFSKIGSIEFLREIGKYFTVNTMMKRDSIARRLEGENGISYTEFSYSLMQGYDFYYLFKEKKCDLQIGGSDQWGNIVSGIDFIRKKTGEKVYGLTIPLVIDKTTGKKFGKSEGNAIWLDPAKTSFYQFYQFWINVDDSNVINYLKLYTFISLADIVNIETEHQDEPHLRKAQKVLAYEVTEFVHGEVIAKKLVRATELLFKNDQLNKLSNSDVDLMEKYAPISNVGSQETLLDVIVQNGLATSKNEGRKFIINGAIRIDGRVVDENVHIAKIQTSKRLLLLSRGKKKKIIIRIKK